MIKVNIGLKGSGKTPKLIEAVNAAIDVEKGNVVCITEGNRLMHDIALALMAVQTQTTEILSEFPTKAAKEPASPPKTAEEIPLF